MKNFLVLALLFPMLLFGQDSTMKRSKFERFSDETGRMFKFENITIGKIKNIAVIVSKVTDMYSGESEKAIKISQEGGYSYGHLTIDLEEIDGVVKAFDFFKNTVKENKPKNDPAYIYTTSNDVVVTCNYLDVAFLSGWYVNISKEYHYSKSVITGSTVSIRNKDIDDLADLMSAAKEKAHSL